MLQLLFVCVLVVHGVIHLMGAAKAFGWAKIDALHEPITKLEGAAWLITAILFVVSGVMFSSDARAWWLAAAPAVILSQVVIRAAWHDARFGTIANVIIVVPVVLAVADLRPTSLRQTYLQQRDAALAEAQLAQDARGNITEADLDHLPRAVQRYLKNVGVVGMPHVHNVRVQWSGTIRNSADGTWMPFHAEQLNVFGSRSARYFFIESTMFGVPFDGLHVYEAKPVANATMDVRVAGVFPVVDARGAEMDRSETVTMFNDICTFAPAALIDAPITWDAGDERSVTAVFRNGGHEVRAELIFGNDGNLIDFVSEDRFQTSDGKTYRRLPWTTPLSGYRFFESAGARLASAGEAMWLTPEGPLVYGKLELVDVDYNVSLQGPEGAR